VHSINHYLVKSTFFDELHLVYDGILGLCCLNIIIMTVSSSCVTLLYFGVDNTYEG